MNGARANFSPLDRTVLESAERQFPKISEEACPERNGGACAKTGRACRLYDCPKLIGGQEGVAGRD